MPRAPGRIQKQEMHPTAGSWDVLFIPGAAGPAANPPRGCSTLQPAHQRQRDEEGEVSPAPFARHLPPGVVPGLLPRAAGVTFHRSHVPLARSGCPAEQSRPQQPVGPGDSSLPSQPKSIWEAAAPSEHPGVCGQQ